MDPGQRLHAPLDIAVKGGKILEMSPDIPESRALTVYSAKDKIVTPGFIDLHVHCFDGVGSGMNADHYCLGRGVTTVVDAGSTGFIMVGAFIKHVVKTSTTRIHPLVDIGALGTMTIHECPNYYRDMYIPDFVLPQSVAKAAMDNRPDVVGIKIHLDREVSSHPLDFEPELLKKAVEAAEAAAPSVDGARHEHGQPLAGLDEVNAQRRRIYALFPWFSKRHPGWATARYCPGCVKPGSAAFFSM